MFLWHLDVSFFIYYDIIIYGSERAAQQRLLVIRASCAEAMSPLAHPVASICLRSRSNTEMTRPLHV